MRGPAGCCCCGDVCQQHQQQPVLTALGLCVCVMIIYVHSVPASRLVLKAKPFSCAAARHHVMSQLELAGGCPRFGHQ
jgi:hypothetical protein